MLVQAVKIFGIYYKKLVTVIAFERRQDHRRDIKTVYSLIPFDVSYTQILFFKPTDKIF